LLDGAALPSAGVRFVKALIKSVTVPTRTAVIFPYCIIFVLFQKGATFCKIRFPGGITVMKALQNILFSLSWC